MLAAAALFGAATAVLAPLAAESGQQIGSRAQGISEMMEDSRSRAGEALVQTWAHSANGTTTLHLSSVGERDVRVSEVLAGGAPAAYRLSGRGPAGTLEAGGLGVLSVNGTGAILLVSESGKLFEFDP